MSTKHESHHDNRAPYEFTFDTKREALERAGYKCEVCGKQDDKTNRLEVNHIVAIWFSREVGGALPAEVIKNIANAQVLCKECHSKYHIDESRTFYAEMAPQVLKKYLDSIIDPHLDDWRDKVRKAYYATNKTW